MKVLSCSRWSIEKAYDKALTHCKHGCEVNCRALGRPIKPVVFTTAAANWL